jgi:hypothetical protein
MIALSENRSISMARTHTSDISVSDLTQSTLIFGGLCLCALHFGSMIETTGHAAMIEEVKVAQAENSIGSESPDLQGACGKGKFQNAKDHHCKSTH